MISSYPAWVSSTAWVKTQVSVSYQNGQLLNVNVDLNGTLKYIIFDDYKLTNRVAHRSLRNKPPMQRWAGSHAFQKFKLKITALL